MGNFASTLVKFSKLSHIQTTIWRPPKMAPPRTAGSAGPFVTPLIYSICSVVLINYFLKHLLQHYKYIIFIEDDTEGIIM